MTTTSAAVPLPFAGGWAGNWESDEGRMYRYCFGAARPIVERDGDSPLSPFSQGVEAGVRQWGDGQVDAAFVYIGDSALTTDAAREFARALIACADEIDALLSVAGMATA